MNDPHIFSRVGGTRFVLALGCCVVNTLLLIFAYVNEGTYQVLILGTVGAYITGNTLQNASESFASRGNNYERGGHDQRQY